LLNRESRSVIRMNPASSMRDVAVNAQPSRNTSLVARDRR
jgi:hypothetical protein